MSRYAVGDIQGCLQPLQCLLEQVQFEPCRDQLWCVGDLINRGPDSLGSLRFIHSLGPAAKIVLGNHDLHLLAYASGTLTLDGNHSACIDSILKAPDAEELCHWLQQQPLIHCDPSGDFAMVHAGIPPNWSLEEAVSYAGEVEAVLRSDRARDYFTHMYGNLPKRWDPQPQGWPRLRLITNYLTRVRFCTADGELEFDSNGTDSPGIEFQPWFEHRDRKTAANKLIFGHWAALQGLLDRPRLFGLDTGCVWGGSMTLMDIDRQQFHACKCTGQGDLPQR